MKNICRKYEKCVKAGEVMGKSRSSKLNGYRSMVSKQKNDVYKFKPKKKKKG